MGSGGREHALAWKLSASPQCRAIVAAPGNPGIAAVPKTTCAAIPADDRAALCDLAIRERADLVVCGPEGPLAAGLGDEMRRRGLRFFGPSAAAAEIEGSKAFAKELMADAGVPTAAFGVFEEIAPAEAFIDNQPGAVVVKADGLCAGKGVVVAATRSEAKAAVRRMIGERAFGGAGARVVIEERLSGREVSMMALCDGAQVALLASAEDHKAVGDGDTGPNTGGMGAYSPSPLVDETAAASIVANIFLPVVRSLAARGRRFTGLLYGGLMLTPDRGPMVIEWNCRFGDPETQVVLARMDDDLLPWLVDVAEGEMPAGAPRFSAGAAVCVVLAAAGYPSAPRTGDVIDGLPPSAVVGDGGALVFHAGTRAPAGGRVVTAGGRVLGVTATGRDLQAARAAAYQAADGISFAGMHYRRDIGARRTK